MPKGLEEPVELGRPRADTTDKAKVSRRVTQRCGHPGACATNATQNISALTPFAKNSTEDGADVSWAEARLRICCTLPCWQITLDEHTAANLGDSGEADAS